jgi:hypothetical protein
LIPSRGIFTTKGAKSTNKRIIGLKKEATNFRGTACCALETPFVSFEIFVVRKSDKDRTNDGS